MCTKEEAEKLGEELRPGLRQEAIVEEIELAEARGSLSCKKFARVGRLIPVSELVFVERQRLITTAMPKIFKIKGII